MTKGSIWQVIMSMPEDKRKGFESNEVENKLDFLARKKTKLSEIYKRIMYNEEKKIYCDLNQGEFSAHYKIKNAVYSMVEAGFLSSVIDSFLFLAYGKGLPFSLYIGVSAASAALYGSAIIIYKKHRGNLGKKLAEREENLVEALNDIYLIKSKEYKNAF